MFEGEQKPEPLLAPVVYETKIPLFFSFYTDGAFEKKWLPWRANHFVLREDASLTYTKKKTTSKPSKSFNILNNEENDNVLDLSDSITIEKIPIDSSSAGGSGNTSSNSTEYPLGSAIGVISDIGVRVTCKKYGIDTEFRVVFPEQELMHFVDALCNITTIRNLSEFKRVMHWDDKPDWIPVSSTISSRNPLVGTFIDPTNVEAQFNMSRMTHGSDDSADSLDAELMGYSTSYDANALSNMVSGPISMLMSTLSFNGAENRVGSKSHKVAMERSHGSELNAYGAQQSMGGGKQYIIQQSVMRRAITKAMDRYDRDARISQTIARRGAFRWLPVAFTNDLVHGSWWFVFGALLTTVISVIILLNSYYPHQLLGVDRDMGLPLHLYRVTWIMLSLSGALYFIGSLAFVRAVNEPPMRPLFPNWSHAATDELLGSWLFFYGTVPSIPYSILYLYWFGNYWYLGMLIVAVISTMACYLFVLSCYPSDKGRTATILGCLTCCCGRRQWIEKHLANDWLAGTWVMYYGTLLGTIACLALFVVTLVDATTSPEDSKENWKNNNIALFIYGTSFLDYIGFLLGAVYFVAGSYPVENTSNYHNTLHSVHGIGMGGGSMGGNMTGSTVNPFHGTTKSPEFDMISDHSTLMGDV